MFVGVGSPDPCSPSPCSPGCSCVRGMSGDVDGFQCTDGDGAPVRSSDSCYQDGGQLCNIVTMKDSKS